MPMAALKRIQAGVLEVAYEEAGDFGGKPVILLHGFPYDVRAYDDVAARLAASGCRVLTPYLRGYGPTRFLSADTPRSGQQAVLAQDLLSFMDALAIPSATLAGYDWGGRAACIVATLWPDRADALVTGNGYNLQNIPRALEPSSPQNEFHYWYQWYFHGERGRRGLEQNRQELCKLLWHLWSPNWEFDDATYARTAPSFDNPDFVHVVVHSYRHRYGLVPGDPAVEAIEEQLTRQPVIGVPTVAMDGDGDGVMAIGGCAGHERHFKASYQRVVIPRVGHNLPQEAPQAFADAVLSVMPGD
jgi:pimeloyl-ACP methyl ester carboxylesterase